MPETETGPTVSSSTPVLTNCPLCNADLAVLRVIPGRSGSEYWTLRCTRCGGIHLDIVKTPSPSAAIEPLG
jgi:uncharacterized Zn finger protein